MDAEVIAPDYTDAGRWLFIFMATIAEQIQCKCIHFNGVQNKTCKIHIPYESVRLPDVKPFKFPCLKNSMHGGYCEFATFPTKEEAINQAAEMAKAESGALMAMVAVKEHVKYTGVLFGKIECPSCKGELKYAQASNGHTRGNCNCGINWME